MTKNRTTPGNVGKRPAATIKAKRRRAAAGSRPDARTQLRPPWSSPREIRIRQNASQRGRGLVTVEIRDLTAPDFQAVYEALSRLVGEVPNDA